MNAFYEAGKMNKTTKKWMMVLALGATTACAQSESTDAPAPSLEVSSGDYVKTVDGKGDSSIEAIILDFEFDGYLETNSRWSAESRIDEQLLYTIGHLNEDNSVGRLDKVDLSDVQVTENEDGTYRVDYHAKMIVAWGKRDQVPAEYTFRLPRDVSRDGLQAFTDAYSSSCVDWGAHDVTTSSMWYYYRPGAYRCDLDETQVAEFTATATVSDLNTTGKYPEYDKIWEDDTLKAVIVFGKNKDGETSNSDAGIKAYNNFVSLMKNGLTEYGYETVPTDVPSQPGVEFPDITFTADIGDGKTVEVVALLVDNVRTAGAEFDARYEELSGPADLIAYFGHSGLGANIRALARKGRWIEDQYVIVFMNGCDTYTYVDRSLADAHAVVNPNQTSEYQYIDLLMNAMPAYFSTNASNAMAVIRALLRWDDPVTYETMFEDIDDDQVVIVSGEQDNTYVPGGGGDGTDEWEGLEEAGTVAAGEEMHYMTPLLAAGTYEFQLSGTEDADLYVRVGDAPTESRWDCRPYRYGSSETCVVELPSDAPIGVMVRGWAPSSDFTLVGGRQ